MAQTGKSPPAVSLAGSGLEYRAGDDAWYDVKVSLQGERLTLNYSMLFGPASEEVYDARDFKTLDDVLRFRKRFRPLSAQVQDTECRSVVPGVKVCASYCSSEDNLRYFDALVEQVDISVHSVKEGEEQCSCTFILYWLHGPGEGDLTTATVADICLLKDDVINQALARFIEMARRLVSDSSYENQPSNAAHEPGNEKETTFNQIQEDEASFEHHYQDADMGGVDMRLKKFVMGGYSYGLVVNNLEKDLTPLTMTKFIRKEIHIESRAHIFPSIPTDMYTRGIIEVKSREELIKLNDFLESTNQIIVASRNRPWVITEKFLMWDEMKNVTLTQENQQVHGTKCDNKLKIVRAGTPEYDMAKQCRENFIEFYIHGKRMLKRLAFEEQKIMSRWIVS